MSSSKFVQAVTSKGRTIRFFAELEWRRLQPSKRGGVEAALRESGKALSSSYGLSLPLAGSTPPAFAGGIYSHLEKTSPGLKAHSIAAAFARSTFKHPLAVLWYKFTDEEVSLSEGGLRVGDCLLIVVERGMPVIDKVADEVAASVLLSNYISDGKNFSIVSNDTVRHPSSLQSEKILETLANFSEKSTTIKAIPIDLTKFLVFGLILSVAAVGYWWYQKNEREKERLQLLQQRQANDPALKYQNAVRARLGELGLDRQSLTTAWTVVEKIPASVPGWNLTRVGCEAGGCFVEFARAMGRSEELKDALSKLSSITKRTFEPSLSLDGKDGIDLNRSRWTWKEPLKPVAVDMAKAPSKFDFTQGDAADLLQTWMTAGLSVQIRPPALWPQVPGVPSTFQPKGGVYVGQLVVAGISLPFVGEVLTEAPANVVWRGFEVSLADERQSPINRAKAQLKGVFYVKGA